MILLGGSHEITALKGLLVLFKALVIARVIVGASRGPGPSRLLLDRLLGRLVLAGYIMIVLSRHNTIDDVGGVGRHRVWLVLSGEADLGQFCGLLVQRDEVLDQRAALVQNLVKLVVLRNSSGLLLLEQVLNVG